MKIRKDWRARLSALVEGKEWATISRQAGLSPTYLRDTLKKKDTSTPLLPKAEKLSGALGVPITEWFLEAEEAPQAAIGPRERVISPVTMPKDVPVHGVAACGEDGEFELNTGNPIDFVRRPERIAGSRDAYALYVVGSSMSPWREEGQVVYVAPHQPPKIGDYVVVQLRPTKGGENPRAFIKRLVRRNEREVVVEQFKPAKTRSFPAKSVANVHRIIDWSELLGI